MDCQALHLFTPAELSLPAATLLLEEKTPSQDPLTGAVLKDCFKPELHCLK